ERPRRDAGTGGGSSRRTAGVGELGRRRPRSRRARHHGLRLLPRGLSPRTRPVAQERLEGHWLRAFHPSFESGLSALPARTGRGGGMDRRDRGSQTLCRVSRPTRPSPLKIRLKPGKSKYPTGLTIFVSRLSFCAW